MIILLTHVTNVAFIYPYRDMSCTTQRQVKKRNLLAYNSRRSLKQTILRKMGFLSNLVIKKSRVWRYVTCL